MLIVTHFHCQLAVIRVCLHFCRECLYILLCLLVKKDVITYFHVASTEPWIDLILIVKNLGSTSESCKAKLAEMFPDADIAFHKDSTSEFLKG